MSPQNINTKTIKKRRITKKKFKGLKTTLLVIFTGLTVAANVWNILTYRSATRDENRAYLTITIVPDSINYWAANIIIKNVGKTPAYKVTHFWGTRISNRGIDPSDMNSIKEDTTYNRSFIGPNMESSYLINKNINLNKETIDSIYQWKGIGLYCFGRFTYEDKFGCSHSLDYWTLFHATQGKYLYVGNLNQDD